jgi:hypothetical protein
VIDSAPARVASGPDVNPARSLLRAAAAPAIVATLLVSGVVCILDDLAGGASALLGGLLAILSLAVGPLVMRAGARMSPPGLLALAVAAYAAVVFALGLVYALLAGADWLDGTAIAAGIIAVTAAWLAGQLWRTRKLRVLAFGSRPEVNQQ